MNNAGNLRAERLMDVVLERAARQAGLPNVWGKTTAALHARYVAILTLREATGASVAFIERKMGVEAGVGPRAKVMVGLNPKLQDRVERLLYGLWLTHGTPSGTSPRSR